MSQVAEETIDLYVPEYCNQGERIPFFVLWDHSKQIKISIVTSEGITLDEVYNVDHKELDIDKNEYAVKKFETPGYLGGVFGSKIFDEASVIKTLRFEINFDSNEPQIIEKQIELFRPDVEIIDTIKKINVVSDRNDRPITDGGIKIFNHGKGTAIIRINVLEKSEIREGPPEGFEEFKIKFLNDLNVVFMKMKDKFPQYNDVIEASRMVAKNPLPSDQKELNSVKTTIERLEKLFDNDEEFLREFTVGVGNAYLRNVSIMTDADAFLAFLKSLGKNKLLILDSMKSLKVFPTTQMLNVEILITDLAQNAYPSKKLYPIAITSDKKYSVPFYQILDSPEVT